MSMDDHLLVILFLIFLSIFIILLSIYILSKNGSQKILSKISFIDIALHYNNIILNTSLYSDDVIQQLLFDPLPNTTSISSRIADFYSNMQIFEPESLSLTQPLSNSLSINNSNQENNHRLLCGVPSLPYYLTISYRLYRWIKYQSFPIPQLTDFNIVGMGHLVNKEAIISFISKYQELICQLGRMENNINLYQSLYEVFSLFSLQGLTYLLGMTSSIGSFHHLPPLRSVMIDNFQSIHPGARELSVGARALAKHHQRSGTSRYWGNENEMKGSEKVLNERALSRINILLSECIWMNSHVLPHQTKVFEIRVDSGYGARWSHDGTIFRGFLEPYMDNGHALKWKH